MSPKNNLLFSKSSCEELQIKGRIGLYVGVPITVIFALTCVLITVALPKSPVRQKLSLAASGDEKEKNIYKYHHIQRSPKFAAKYSSDHHIQRAQHKMKTTPYSVIATNNCMQ